MAYVETKLLNSFKKERTKLKNFSIKGSTKLNCFYFSFSRILLQSTLINPEILGAGKPSDQAFRLIDNPEFDHNN